MNDMAGSPSRSTLATPQFWLRHDGRSLTYAKSTLFTPILCEYRRSGRTLSAVANARRRVARRRIQTNGQKGPPGVVWIKNHRNVCNVGRDLFQSLQHLADDLDLHFGKASRVAAGASEAFHVTPCDSVHATGGNNRNRADQFHQDRNNAGADGQDHV